MMTYAYDKLYIGKARIALARMLDYAVHDLNYELKTFWNLFLSSGVAKRFGEGDCSLTVGKSGIEIAYEVLDSSGIENKFIKPRYTSNRSREYWTGWSLAWYQWQKGVSFESITDLVSIDYIRNLYEPYHEMDIRQFRDRMDEDCRAASKTSRLKRIRMKSGYTQKELSKISGVPLRTLQQYEQKQKNINKAQADYIIRLSKSLSCKTEDLMENF